MKKYNADWDLANEVHNNGEIWASACWMMRGNMNATMADKLILEGFSSTPSRAQQTMKDVALLIYFADETLNSGANEAVIRNAFNTHEITQDADYPLTGNTVAGVTGEATLRTYAHISSVAAPTGNYGPSLPMPGRFFFADSNATTGGVFHVRRVDANGSYATVAGGGSASPDSGVDATTVKLTDIDDIAVDGEYRVFIAGGDTQKVYRVDTSGMMERIAGGGITPPSTDTTLDPLDAKLGTVVSIAVRVNSSALGTAPDRAGGTEMWIADKVVSLGKTEYFVRHIYDTNSSDGRLHIVTVAGGGLTDLDQNASNALDNWFRNIDDITVDSLGQVFIADNDRQVVRRLNIVGSVPPVGQAAPPGSTTIVAGVTTITGGGDDTAPFDGNATLKRIGAVSLAVDSGNNLLFAGSTPNSGQRIRKVYLGSGTIPMVFSNGSGAMVTAAGGGTVGLSTAYSGGLVFARQADFTPTLQELAVDIAGNIFIDDVNATESIIWQVDNEVDTPMPWADGQLVYLVDTNATSPTSWPALPPYTGYSFPANMRDNVGNVTYHGPYWVNVDDNASANPHINRFWLSTEPNGRFINGTWTNFGTSNNQPFDALRTVMLDNYGSFYLVEGNSLDVTITAGWDGPTNCDLVKANRLDLLTDAADINLRPSEQVDFVYRQGDSVMSGANPLVITPGIFDPAYSGVIGVTTNNAVVSAGGLRMALNTGSRTSGATYFGGLKTEPQRYEILHDANGTFRFNGDLYETPQRIMDARADLVCLLISGGGGGLGQYYTKTARGPVAIPDMIQDSTRLEDVKRNDHPNVIRNRDGINYSVCQWDGSMPYYVFAAEVGHNLGCGHGIGDRNGNVGIPVNPMDYKNTGISKGQDNTTFSPYRNDRISTPEFPAGSGALVKDSYIALGTYFTAKNSTQGKFGTISVYAGLPGGRPAFRKVGLYSSPLIYYQGTNIGEQYGWRIPPPQGRYNEPLPFDNAKAMTTVGTVVAFYRDSNGAGRTGPEEVVVPEPPRGVISAMPGRVQNNGVRRNSRDPVSYAPGVVPLPGSLPNIQYAAAPAAKAGGLGAATNPTAPKPKPGGLPAVVTPVPPNPKPGGGLGGTINPAPPPVTTIPGLPNDHRVSVWPPPINNAPAPRNQITAPLAVFPARANAILMGTNRGATREKIDMITDNRGQLVWNGRRTVWFRWNAPAQGSGSVQFSTKGSDFDTVIKVERRSPTGALEAYDVQDNAKTGPWSEGKYQWKPGQIFLICIDGVGGAQGTIRISAQIE